MATNNATNNQKDITAQTGILKGNGSIISAVTAPSGSIVGTTDAQTLTNKTLTTPVIGQVNNSTAPGVKIQTNVHFDNSDTPSNSTAAGVFMQFGWGQIQGNSTASMNESVSFKTSFATVYGVIVSPLATASGSAASDITGITTSGLSVVNLWAYGISTSGFSIVFNRSSGTFGNTFWYAYSWIAWGV